MKSWDNDGANQSDPSGRFNKTQWSVVLRAKNDSFTALDTLFTRYRKPMIIHVHGKGFTPDRAEDIVQGFCERLIKRGAKHFLVNVAPWKGKFRTFLLTSLDNYIRDEIASGNAIKRGEGISADSLEEVDSEGMLVREPKVSTPSADLEYDRAWAQTILHNSLQQLKKGYSENGKAGLYSSLEPVMYGDSSSLSYSEIGKRFGKSEDAVKKEAQRMREKFRVLIQEELKQTVSSEDDFKEELAYLISLFGQSTN